LLYPAELKTHINFNFIIFRPSSLYNMCTSLSIFFRLMTFIILNSSSSFVKAFFKTTF
jgi:hypothetical protein